MTNVNRLLVKLIVGMCTMVGFASAVPAASPEGMKLYVFTSQPLDIAKSALLSATTGTDKILIPVAFLEPGQKRVVVPVGFDAADDWIAGRVGPRHIVITTDVRLASRGVKAGATVIAPNGRPFTEDNIGMAVAMPT